MSTSNSTNHKEWQRTVCVRCDHSHLPREACVQKANTVIETGEQDSLIGTVLGDKYRIEEKIGAGGMCQVYRATQVLIGKSVAVKLLHPQLAVDQQLIRRFENEASTLGRLSHPHAINVFDFGFTHEGSPYLVMDFISGRTLDEVIRLEGPLPVWRTRKLLQQICGALQAAHTEGIIHRDIKPENILVSSADGEDWVTVVDFGIAKLQEGINPKGKLTADGIIIGTPLYMSPEQSEGKDLDSRSDVYSLGVVLYEMLAGEAPFSDDSSARLLIKHISEPPPPLRQKRPDIPESVAAVVMRALAKDPAERPSSASALGKAFEETTANLVSHKTQLSKQDTQLVVLLNPDEKVSEQVKPTQLRKDLPSRRTPARGFLFGSSLQAVRQHGKALTMIFLAVLMVLWLSFFRSQPQPQVEMNTSLNAVKATQQIITQAINQITPLPKENLLRDQLPELIQWQQELERYGQTASLSPAAQARIQTMERLAKEYTEQAQLAAVQNQNTAKNDTAQQETVSDSALVQEAGAVDPNEMSNEKAQPAPPARNSARKRAKGPNKFARVFKKILLIP